MEGGFNVNVMYIFGGRIRCLLAPIRLMSSQLWAFYWAWAFRFCGYCNGKWTGSTVLCVLHEARA